MHVHPFAMTLVALATLFHCVPGVAEEQARPRRPSIVLIVADDLGYGDLGCFGQKMLKTPKLDGMAAEGMRFTQFYAGSALGGPSRCVMLTGRHAGRAAVRGHTTLPIAIPPDQATVAMILKSAGYATGFIGKWEIGSPANLTGPNAAGFEHVSAETPDLWLDDALRFIRDRQKVPFFLMLSLNKPGTYEPGKEALKEFAANDWPQAEKRFAAAIQAMDQDVGRVLGVLKDLGMEKNTLVIFTSGNGPNEELGHSAQFFSSTGKHRGSRGGLNEGGIRVPMIAWWPGTIAPGSENDRQWYLGDLMATAAELSETKSPEGLDSDSFVAALRGQPSADKWKRKSPLYWECYEGKTVQAVRFGKWKALRSPMFGGPIELYDMSNDPGEKHDYSIRRPQLTEHAINLLNKHHHPDPNWKVPHSP